MECNVAGWEMSGLDPHHTPPPHRAERGAVDAQQPSNKEEGARSVRDKQ